MDVSSLASSRLGGDVGVSVMKKAINIQEKQMQDLLQSSAADIQNMQSNSSSGTASKASKSSGVGANLNIMA